MKLNELDRKDPKDMTKEELEQDMLAILGRMNEDLDEIDEKVKADNAKSNRRRDRKTLQKNTSAV